MKIADILIWIIILLVAITPTAIFLKKKKEKERLPEYKKACHAYDGTYSWLMSVYDDLFHTRIAYRSSSETTTSINGSLPSGLNLRGLVYMDVISEQEAIVKGENTGRDDGKTQYTWARKILLEAIEKGISFEQSLINNLDYHFADRLGKFNCDKLKTS